MKLGTWFAMQTVKFICLLDTLIYIFQYIESWLGRWQANYDYIHFPNAPSNSRGWKMLHFLLGQFRPIFRDVLLLISGSVLVGGFNPSEKYDREIGNLHQIGMDIKIYLSCHHRSCIIPTYPTPHDFPSQQNHHLGTWGHEQHQSIDLT